MRYALALVAAALLAPASLRAADPPITFQTQPINRILDDVRAAADLIGGEKAVKSFNAGIKEKFGDKGFDGLDLNRPVVGYVVLAPKVEDVTVVVAFPVTTEKDFIALCDRFNGMPPKDLGKGLYALPALDSKQKARLRFSDQYAYISYGANPEPALDAKVLVGPNKLIDPADQALFSGKFHFDRLTLEVKKALPSYLAEIKKGLGFGDEKGAPGAMGLGGDIKAVFNPLFEQIEKMCVRFALLLNGGDAAALRVTLDVPAGEFAVEAALKSKPDTPLATAIAAQKPTGNKFGSLITPDTVAGFQTRLPFFTNELRTGAVKSLEEGQKLGAQAGPFKDLVDELFKGLIRTVKTGEVDVVGGIRGPDKNGDFTGVLAVAFEDPSGLEKEFKKVIENQLPGDEQENFKWGADKAGKVGIHTYKAKTRGGWEDFSKPFGKEKAVVAFAFAPHGVFVVVGPDPVPVLKAALAVKPVEAPVLDIVVNPAKMKKFAEKTGERGEDVERALGKEDKLLSAMSLNISGGKELKVRYALNLRLIPKALAAGEISDQPVEVVPPKK